MWAFFLNKYQRVLFISNENLHKYKKERKKFPAAIDFTVE